MSERYCGPRNRGRRDFLRGFTLVGGSGLLCYLGFKIGTLFDLDENTVEANATRVQNVLELKQTNAINAQATDYARPTDISREYSEIPSNLFFSTAAIDINKYGFMEEAHGYGSGTIIDYDQSTGIGIFLTAAHVLERIINNRYTDIVIHQPQMPNHPTISLRPEDQKSVVHSKKDIGVIAFRCRDNYYFGSFGEANLDTDWVPNTDENLFYLAFPYVADKHGRSFPNKFKLLETSADAVSYGYKGYITNERSTSSAASGAAVVRSNGQAIAIISQIREGTGNALLCPIGNEYFDLRNRALRDLRSS
jgi:hypothetical protein